MSQIYRNIYVAIWVDDKFPFVSDDCQAVWFHLATCRHLMPIGYIIEPIEGLAAEKNKNGLWTLERYKRAFAEGLPEPLAKGFLKGFDEPLPKPFGNGFFDIDEKHQVIRFPKWFDWNRPDNPNILKSWYGWFERIPNCSLKTEGIQQLKELCKKLGEPFAKGFSEWFIKPTVNRLPNRERETETETETNTKTSSSQNKNFCDAAVSSTCTLIARIKQNDPKARTPEPPQNGKLPDSRFLSWVKHIDDINRIDGRDWKIIDQVTHFCQMDGFWKSNILSAQTLRRQFPKLLLQMKRDDWKEEATKETDEERRERLKKILEAQDKK